jgi:Effector Associated Constant Component 1
MDVTIQVAQGDADDVVSLTTWLSAERELRGAVHPVRRPVGDTDLGSLAEIVSVALGSGGAGSVLASSLITWLRTRPTSAKLLVKVGERSVKLEIRTLEEVRPLLEQILNAASND